MSVDAATVSSFTFGYDVADEGGNQTGSLVQVRLVPIGDVNRPPVARPDVARTVSGQADRHPRAGQRLRPRRRRDPGRDHHGPADVRHRHRRRRRRDPVLAAARRERFRPAALHGRRRQRRPCRRRGRDRRAAGRRREPCADRHRRHLHRDRRQRHPAPRRAAQRLRPRRRPAVDRRRRRRLGAGRPSIRPARSASSRRSRSTAPGRRTCRSPTRSPTAAVAPTVRS